MAKSKFVPTTLRKPGDAPPPEDPPLENGDESYVAAQTRRMRAAADTQEAEARIRNLELGKARGDLVQVRDVQISIEMIHRKWVDALDILPSNVVRKLGPIGMDLKERVRTAIDEELNSIREDLANGVQRKGRSGRDHPGKLGDSPTGKVRTKAPGDSKADPPT